MGFSSWISMYCFAIEYDYKRADHVIIVMQWGSSMRAIVVVEYSSQKVKGIYVR